MTKNGFPVRGIELGVDDAFSTGGSHGRGDSGANRESLYGFVAARSPKTWRSGWRSHFIVPVGDDDQRVSGLNAATEIRTKSRVASSAQCALFDCQENWPGLATETAQDGAKGECGASSSTTAAAGNSACAMSRSGPSGRGVESASH